LRATAPFSGGFTFRESIVILYRNSPLNFAISRV
jgi:hypothetical protein